MCGHAFDGEEEVFDFSVGAFNPAHGGVAAGEGVLDFGVA